MARRPIELDTLNAIAPADFAEALGEVFENAPWVAERAAAARPFATVAALHGAMLAAVLESPPEQVVAFLRGHPELGGAAALAGTISGHSTAEQAASGLGRGTGAFDDMGRLNADYAARFGFPFILCVRRHTRASLLAEFHRRLEADPAAERAAALREVGHITRLRLVEGVAGPGAPAVNGSLTTHVLDTVVGRPARGVAVELLEVGGDAAPLARATTNSDGRTDRPLLSGAPLRIGAYELRFHIGAYFGSSPGQPAPFLDIIPVRFGITEPESHLHVPLLVSPGAYSTYRGS